MKWSFIILGLSITSLHAMEDDRALKNPWLNKVREKVDEMRGSGMNLSDEHIEGLLDLIFDKHGKAVPSDHEDVRGLFEVLEHYKKCGIFQEGTKDFSVGKKKPRRELRRTKDPKSSYVSQTLNSKMIHDFLRGDKITIAVCSLLAVGTTVAAAKHVNNCRALNKPTIFQRLWWRVRRLMYEEHRTDGDDGRVINKIHS